MQVHNPYAREDAISRLRDERDAEMRRADAADDLVAELRAERAAALARAEAVEARALAEHQAAADLLAVIARIGECLGIPYSKPDLCHAVEAEVKRLRGRMTELEAALDEARGGMETHRSISDAANRRVAELERANDEAARAYLSLKEKDDANGEPLREACRQNMILTARAAKLDAQLAALRAVPFEYCTKMGGHDPKHATRYYCSHQLERYALKILALLYGVDADKPTTEQLNRVPRAAGDSVQAWPKTAPRAAREVAKWIETGVQTPAP